MRRASASFLSANRANRAFEIAREREDPCRVGIGHAENRFRAKVGTKESIHPVAAT